MSAFGGDLLTTPPPDKKKQEDVFPSDDSEDDRKEFKEKPRTDSMLVATSGDFDISSPSPNNREKKLAPTTTTTITTTAILNDVINTSPPAAMMISSDVTPDIGDGLVIKNNDKGVMNGKKKVIRGIFDDVLGEEEDDDDDGGVRKSGGDDDGNRKKIPDNNPAAILFDTNIREHAKNFEINLHDEPNSDVIEIKVTDAKKVGDGMSAYVAYKVATKTNMKQFNMAEMSVVRRFTDFLVLHDKLITNHQHLGRIVPLPPEKDVIGMAKMKISKEDEFASMEFVEKRRAALERFLMRISRHPDLSKDPSFIEFLQLDGELSKPASTSVFSGAGLAKFFGRVGDSINKMTYTLPEADQWFEDKVEQIEVLENDLRDLHTCCEQLVLQRRDLSQCTNMLSKSVANMGSAEEDLQLSKVLSSLSDVFGKIENIQTELSNLDLYFLSEIIKDNLLMITNLRNILSERVKVHKHWKDTEANLEKKKLLKAKMEIQRKVERMDAVNNEIAELEQKVKDEATRFESVSQTIRQEMTQLDKMRTVEIKEVVIHYLKMNAQCQQQLADLWEAFIPEINQIA